MICQPCREQHDPRSCLYPLSCTCQHRERAHVNPYEGLSFVIEDWQIGEPGEK